MRSIGGQQYYPSNNKVFVLRLTIHGQFKNVSFFIFNHAILLWSLHTKGLIEEAMFVKIFHKILICIFFPIIRFKIPNFY